MKEDDNSRSKLEEKHIKGISHQNQITSFVKPSSFRSSSSIIMLLHTQTSSGPLQIHDSQMLRKGNQVGMSCHIHIANSSNLTFGNNTRRKNWRLRSRNIETKASSIQDTIQQIDLYSPQLYSMRNDITILVQ